MKAQHELSATAASLLMQWPCDSGHGSRERGGRTQLQKGGVGPTYQQLSYCMYKLNCWQRSFHKSLLGVALPPQQSKDVIPSAQSSSARYRPSWPVMPVISARGMLFLSSLMASERGP
jgi:hypothetical protein